MNKLVRSAAVTNDAAAERDGVWCEYVRTNDAGKIETYRVLLSRAGTMNAPFLKLSQELTRKYKRSGTDLDSIDHDTQKNITRELYSRSIVKGWNEEDFGEAFTIEGCKATFEADNDFLDFCVVESNKASVYRKAQTETDTGN